MAACLTCSREMLAASSCRPRLGAIRYGSERHVDGDHPSPCRDCNVLDGGVHHDGCCVEECPACGGQRLACPCNPALRLLRVLVGG
jgi:hypothetical protein